MVEPTQKRASKIGRTLALFFDGTWNDTGDNTNVWRLKSLCADFDALGRPQLTYYDRGVNGFWGGSFGIGLTDNVKFGYEWLVENYRAGDDIFIFGFSRGAYTARCLAGFVAKQGLLVRGAPLGVGQVYDRYKRPGCDTIYTLAERMAAEKPDDFSIEDRWMLKYSQKVSIKMVGVWDTVGALGLPVFHIPGFSSSTLSFLHTGLRQSILNAYHAVAIDEHRGKFAPTLWTKLSTTEAAPRSLEAVEQRWFVGAHANVGGGYFSDPLSQPSLRWMILKAQKLGLFLTGEIIPDKIDGFKVADSYGKFLKGAYSRISPPYFRPIDADPKSTDKPNETERSINETIDASVFERCRQDTSYKPNNLVEWAQRKNVDLPSLNDSVLASKPAILVVD